MVAGAGGGRAQKFKFDLWRWRRIPPGRASRPRLPTDSPLPRNTARLGHGPTRPHPVQLEGTPRCVPVQPISTRPRRARMRARAQARSPCLRAGPCFPATNVRADFNDPIRMPRRRAYLRARTIQKSTATRCTTRPLRGRVKSHRHDCCGHSHR
jgi:hypothetical protein